MADAIIIFGAAVRADGGPSRPMRERVEAALALGTRLDDAFYMPTGGVGRHGPAEALLMRDLLLAAGVPADRIRPEPTAHNTIRSVQACRRLLGRFDGTVYAASSGYHLARCVVLLRIAGLRARACPPLRWRAHPYWWLREAAGLPPDALLAVWWRLRGRLSPTV